MTVQDFYQTIGGSYASAKQRLMSDKLIQKFVPKFLEDPTFGELTKAMAEKDWDAAFRAAHTLKGLALNLAFDPLGNAASALTEALRGQNRDGYTPEQLQELYKKVEESYRLVVSAIREGFAG